MTSAFDPRIVQVGIEIDGELMTFEGLDIRAIGVKYASPTANQCSIQISNLTRDRRNYILTKATPLAANNRQRTPIKVTLDVGRESYGTFRLFEGAAWALGASQPPDIGITLESLTNNLALSLINSNSFSANVPLKTIAQKIADQNGLQLEFKVKNNKNIGSYSYSGSVAKQVQKLAQMGGVNAYVDDTTLVVIDSNESRSDAVILIDEEGGMIGVPQPNLGGVMVRTLINGNIKLGSRVEIVSKINPSVNGQYNVKNINFQVANRSNPFWYDLYCINTWMFGGTQ